MQLTLALPGVFWQNQNDIDYVLQNLELPNFSQLVKRAKISELDFGYSDLVYNQLGYNNESSLAKQTANQLQDDAKHISYLIAEPVHLRVDRDRILIAEPDILQLSIDEAQAIIQAINQHFQDELKVYYLSEHKWVVGFNQELINNQYYPVLDIIGEDIDDYLPSGSNALYLSKIVTEIQMLLFNLQDKLANHNSNLPICNSVWLWDKQVKPTVNQYIQQTIHENGLSLTTNNATIQNLTAMLGDSWQTNLIILDSLYHPCCYSDSYAWVNNFQRLDHELCGLLIKLFKHRVLVQLNLLLPQRDKTLCLQLTSTDKYKFWQHNKFLNLIKGHK